MCRVRNVESATRVADVECQPEVRLCVVILDININKLQHVALLNISCILFLRLSEHISTVHCSRKYIEF